MRVAVRNTEVTVYLPHEWHNVFKSWRHQLYTTALHIGIDRLYELAEFLNQVIVKHMNLNTA